MKQLIIKIKKIFATKAPGHQGFIFIKTLCVTLCLCVLVANFVSGKDKIMCSPQGGSSKLPESGCQISYKSSDGSVKKENLNRIEETEPPVEPEAEPEPSQPPIESIEGISIDEIIEWVKRNPWIIQLVTENPDNQKLKEELVKYFESHAGWEKEKKDKSVDDVISSAIEEQKEW